MSDPQRRQQMVVALGGLTAAVLAFASPAAGVGGGDEGACENLEGCAADCDDAERACTALSYPGCTYISITVDCDPWWHLDYNYCNFDEDGYDNYFSCSAYRYGEE